MGCDIHAMIERRKTWSFIDATGSLHTSWINAGDPDMTRAYDVFSILSDCGRDRYGVTPISQRRGIPDDVCDEFRRYCECWAEDGHSHGWVTLRELQEYDLDAVPWPDGMRENNRHLYGKLVQELERVADRYDGDPDAVRMVFFFDN